MANGHAILEKLFKETRPLSVDFREYLDWHELYDDYEKLGQKLHFERSTYERFGRTPQDKAEYFRQARPLAERMQEIERMVGIEFRAGFLRCEKVGFGIRIPVREPVRYSPILPATWPILRFGFGDDDVASDGISYCQVLVASAHNLSVNDRDALAAELKDWEWLRAKRASGEEAPQTAGALADAIDRLSKSVGNQTVSVSVQQGPVDVRLVDIHPELVKRATSAEAEQGRSRESTPGSQTGCSATVPAKRHAGRPTLKAEIHRLQLERWAAGATADTVTEEARQIVAELDQRRRSKPGTDRVAIPKVASMVNMIGKRYTRLQKTVTAINYLMGIRPN